MIRILLVDDHPSVGEGTKTMLEQDPQIRVNVVLSAVEALDEVKKDQYDIILCDLNMPTISGLELTKRLIQEKPDRKVLIYTGYEINSHFNLLIESGVSGFVSKTVSREQLLNAIYCCMRDEAIIPLSLLRQLRRSEIKFKRGDKTFEEASINEREQEILQEVAEGRSNKDIAAKLHMSQRTVEYNLTRIFEKLGVRSRSEAIVEAARLGLVRKEMF
ncbi:response regulator [Paenibacillus aquistagni]|uniref:Two component transcriptional regulator, LuxR family n=1 Tax=Paenibacillus aquistagni TaxID=1852522 RepID=A0A1X7LPQ4_9BACL|nr:response regulator transcription factor [Paenibacillus aquistagni]SMG55896.1 two component transcriptional regulator, LuxR family [Paenibacillus aquistagni]